MFNLKQPVLADCVCCLADVSHEDVEMDWLNPQSLDIVSISI